MLIKEPLLEVRNVIGLVIILREQSLNTASLQSPANTGGIQRFIAAGVGVEIQVPSRLGGNFVKKVDFSKKLS